MVDYEHSLNTKKTEATWAQHPTVLAPTFDLQISARYGTTLYMTIFNPKIVIFKDTLRGCICTCKGFKRLILL